MNKITVDELCEPYTGQLKLDADTLIDYFDIASVDNVGKRITDCTTYRFCEAPSRARKPLKKNSILVSTVRPNLNAVALFDKETEHVPVASTGFCILNCKADTYSRFLFHYVQSKKFIGEMVSQATGASYPAVSDKIVRNACLPAYSYEEQIHIANVLDRVANVISKRKQQIQKLDELVKARFVEMFDNGNYLIEKLGTVCKKITDGTHKTPTYLDEGITFISAKNIVNGELDFTDIKHISESEYQEIQKRCQTAIYDILLSKSGSLGSPVIVKTEEKLGLFESLAILKYDREKLIPEFLCEQLKTDRIQRQFTTGTKGVAIKHLHLGVIADTDIIVPSLDEQKIFANFVHQVDKSKAAIQKALDEAQLLFDSLMQKYFG